MAEAKGVTKLTPDKISTIEKNLDFENETEAVNYFEIDNNELEKSVRIPIPEDKELNNMLLRVNLITLEFKMILEGKTVSDDNKNYLQTSKAMIGDHSIKLLCSLLQSYSAMANLVSQKDIEKFNIQFIDAFIKANNYILRDRTVKEKDARMIIKLFKDKLCNIGDIITNNKKNMESVMGRMEEVENKNLSADPFRTNPVQVR